MHWPYDEVVLSLGNAPREISIQTPWLTTNVEMVEGQFERAKKLVEQFGKVEISPEYLVEVNWFFESLAKFPLTYQLPRDAWKGTFLQYSVKDDSLQEKSATEFLKLALKNISHPFDLKTVSEDALFKGDWKWDAEGAIQFSTCKQGIDPKSLFSVARRFHLMDSVASNTTSELYEYVKGMASDKEKFKKASSLMVRQNHYVTEKCNGALSPALENAKEARKFVEAFIQAEYGHDRILNAALKSLEKDAKEIPVTSQTKVLMDLLKFSAERNFLAFAMNVDFFERSAYQDSDPLAKVLREGGFDSAAQQIDRHMDINDSGEHENVAMQFLTYMSPIDKKYATEALRIAEATTNAMNLIASGVRHVLDKTDYLKS